MKKLILVLIIGLSLLAGCSSITPLEGIKRSEDVVDVATAGYDVADIPSEKIDFSNAPPGDWIYPAKVEISNMHPGARAEQSIYVHNGGDSIAKFLVIYDDLPNESGGYYWAPKETANWIQVSTSVVEIEPDGIAEILVVLEIPKDAEVLEARWGFLIVSSEASQPGMVKVRNASKWLIDMRN